MVYLLSVENIITLGKVIGPHGYLEHGYLEHGYLEHGHLENGYLEHMVIKSMVIYSSPSCEGFSAEIQKSRSLVMQEGSQRG